MRKIFVFEKFSTDFLIYRPRKPKYYAGLSCDKLDDVQMPEWTLQQLSNIHDVY